MKRRQLLIVFGASALAASFPALAQPGKVARVGFLAVRSRATPPATEPYTGFVQGMRELGYIEGKNLVIEWRYADGKYERLPSLAAELVKLKVEVVVTTGAAANRAALQATTSIPIVGATMSDPVESGFAVSLTRPGGNMTGLALTTTDMTPKHLELIRLVLPKLTRLALMVNLANSGNGAIAKSVQSIAQKLGIKVQTLDARNADGIERAFAIMKRERAEAVIVAIDGFFIGQRQQIAALALKNRLPSIFSVQEHTEAGGLMSYGQNLSDFYRRAAGYVDKILRGAKPGDLPIEQPAIYSLAINRKTAKALGLTISQELMLRSDKVIE